MEEFTLRDALPGEESAVREIVFAVLQEYGLQPDPGGTDADLDDLSASYLARGGTFKVLTTREGALVGCGGLYPLGGGEGEIRKMYLLPAARGRGQGRRMLSHLIEHARAMRLRRVVLETASPLKEAIGLYLSYGFVRYHPPHLASRCDQAFALELVYTV